MNDRFANSEAVVVASKPWPERGSLRRPPVGHGWRDRAVGSHRTTTGKRSILTVAEHRISGPLNHLNLRAVATVPKFLIYTRGSLKGRVPPRGVGRSCG